MLCLLLKLSMLLGARGQKKQSMHSLRMGLTQLLKNLTVINKRRLNLMPTFLLWVCYILLPYSLYLVTQLIGFILQSYILEERYFISKSIEILIWKMRFLIFLKTRCVTCYESHKFCLVLIYLFKVWGALQRTTEPSGWPIFGFGPQLKKSSQSCRITSKRCSKIWLRGWPGFINYTWVVDGRIWLLYQHCWSHLQRHWYCTLVG